MSDSPARETKKERRARLMRRFADAIFIAGRTVDDAARAVGINVRTGSRWLHSPEFRDCLVEANAASPRALLGFARSIIIPALQRLGEIIRNPETPATALVNAIKLAVDLTLRLQEIIEFEQRIVELERLAPGDKQ